MQEQAEAPPGATHVVLNQPLPLEDYNLFEADRVLKEALIREGGDWAQAQISELGEVAGRAETIKLGAEANAKPPRLRSHDRFGHRVDEVEFHPAWHELMRIGVDAGLHASPWSEPGPGAHVARAAGFMCIAQIDAGICCPIGGTYAAVPAIRRQPELAGEWEPSLISNRYDGRARPVPEKAGALCAMGMTEKQGGSDVRANTTTAVPTGDGGPGAPYELTGHKWFFSAPMCDVFLMLAQAPGGLSCFLLPRWREDGTRNGMHLQRLKDKLGNRSNASSELEMRGAEARLVGEEGRGVPTIIEMVNHTRLDCVLGASAGLRLGVAQASWHAGHRSVFGKRLIEQPLMLNVLADLAVESEAATTSAMWLARIYDSSHLAEADGGEERTSRLLRRVATPVLKYWICKRAPWHAVESLECLGGNGYVEESGMPRLYRESPLQSIWEGAGNVQALDVLRAMVSRPESVPAFFAEVDEARGSDSRLDDYADRVREGIGDMEGIEARARRLVEGMALALQGSLLLRYGDPAVADAFCASRLGGDWGAAFGTLPAGCDLDGIVARHAPAL
ncbi:MAG TPA: acyl-CoA dehydrogenase family protein [Solirubrobacterales bacterium]|nr:acyl-CoA dehydrogenase family protein [Solirubrobacterales bacterium]